ncbi:hypothetical protein FB451DRAFT_1208721 [Mycena latifolia]|nr:hypothetical protein FB451DRAFT_1208721 [Mycena latifolia]
MPPRRTTKTKRNPNTIMAQTLYAVMTCMKRVDDGETISMRHLIDEVAKNARRGGYQNGKRLKDNVEDRLYACVHNKFIDVNFDQGTLRITPLGRLTFQGILDEVREYNNCVDEGEEISACFLVIKRTLGPLNSLSKAQMRIGMGRLLRREQERILGYLKERLGDDIFADDQAISSPATRVSAFPDQVGGHLEPAAGPSMFSNGTPIRKALSMGIWATPASLPRSRPLRPEFTPPSPSPSPTRRNSPAMDIDDLDTNMEYSDPQPSQRQLELQAELVDAQIKLLESQRKLQETEERNQRQVTEHQVRAQEFEAQIAKLVVQQHLHGQNTARVHELEEEIKSLRARILDLQGKIRDMREAEALECERDAGRLAERLHRHRESDPQ